ncbi:receptor-type tyrosine-protein phosphatase alpha-like [Diadema antillarum]|uniref:receptor-type tyrosine-protein phosphatase alpha-like n=1 Tax=Diadema antillarum TaxID=105358 RepID=UPI003A86BED0
MTNINSRGVTGFQDEFEIFQLEVTYPTDVANKKENQKKNRFLNVLPYDHSRVKLNLRGKDPNSDYINASWIHGYDAPKKYIAAQGPAVASINDFWRMIWKYGCKRVIMLTNLVEGKKRKCEQYWPDESCSYGEIYVAAKSKEVTKNYTIRRFDIDMAGVHRELVQFHYTAWPDMGVPEQPSQLMNFIEVTREGEGASKSPIIVHCSAGVGRTGTFITLDAMVDQMNAEGAVGIFNFVAGMRQHRAKMVQVVEQYQFIYATLLEALTCGDTSIPKVDFMRRYRALKTPSPDTGVTSLQEEFELLRSYTVIPGEDEVSAATREENLSKNRYRNKVPPDRVRPYLMTEVEGGTNYINATYFPGRKTRNQYITTQSPLPNTAVDFWRLVVDYKVTRIMMLHGDTPDETFAKYWSEDDELICGPFAVTSAKEVIVPGIVERTLTVRKQTSKRPSQTVYQLQLECSIVEDDGLPSASDMIFMRTRLKSWPTHGHDSSPILVHCRDGVGTSATFCAFLTIMDKADCSEDVEIFQVCKKMRAVRPEAISHMKEYQLLYDVLQEYISSFEIYENCRG